MGNNNLMNKILLTNGDSWTFGSEIMAPEFCVPENIRGNGMSGRFKEGYDCYMECNDYYRIPRTWSSYLGGLLNVDQVINISRPGRSNDTIYETTIGWILENYISKNKSTDDLLVVIGWSSPERKNIIIGDSGDKTDSTEWLTLWPSMEETKYYSSPVIKEFFKFYVTHQWLEQEFLKRYIEQNIQLQNFCKLYNIDYFIFNAFYAHPRKGPNEWTDISIIDKINSWTNLSDGWNDKFYNWEFIKSTLCHQWQMIDEQRFINKNSPNGSFRSYIFDNVDESIRMCNWHPGPNSHEAWAKFLASHINSIK